MGVYISKNRRLSGTNWRQVMDNAFDQYKIIKRKTKRRPYVRSAYFTKEKVFLELFWHHLHEKQSLKDKTRRLKYFPCAIELIEKNRQEPSVKMNPNRSGELLYRFLGITPDGDSFAVQIKEDIKSRQKWLISIFPLDK